MSTETTSAPVTARAHRRRTTPGTIVRQVVLAVLGLIWLMPVYLMLANASKRPEVVR